eukprot:2604006-Pyramimonas_sp.AAC.1
MCIVTETSPGLGLVRALFELSTNVHLNQNQHWNLTVPETINPRKLRHVRIGEATSAPRRPKMVPRRPKRVQRGPKSDIGGLGAFGGLPRGPLGLGAS